MTTQLEPDQDTKAWDDHVRVYEDVFEPFTLALARQVFGALAPIAGRSILDVGAGSGGAALELAQSGAHVTAVDGSPAMVARVLERASSQGVAVDARQMDASALAFADDTFDAALSTFGIILAPDAVGALSEMRRVVKPGGRVAVVTWTEPQRYELAANLSAAISEVWPDRPRSPLPAQLRFKEVKDFSNLFDNAGLGEPQIEVIEAELTAPSARWLADRIAFAPGMMAALNGLGERREACIAAFLQRLQARFADGPVQLGGAAFAGVAKVA